MSFQYDFPSELLLAIFGVVESYDDLLTLAATCRRFNHLSLQVFFSNYNFDPNSKTIILQPYDGSLENISALEMSLALRKTSLEHLSFDSGGFYDTNRIHTLTRYIMNLSTVDRVTLHIASVDGDWKAAYGTLLDTVIGRSCSNLHVATRHSWEQGEFLSISKTPSWFRIPRRRSEAVEKSNGEVKHLKDCFIETFPTFLRPFYLRVLKANSPILTGLAFRYIFGSMAAIDLGFLITNIHLPVLKRFAISFCNIPGDAITKFLTKHPHITNFEYHHITYTPKPKGVPRGLKGVFNHLEQLTTTPEDILTLLPTMDRMPYLTSIIIEDGPMHSGAAEHAFIRCLSSCVKKIELTLDISSLHLSGYNLEALPEVVQFGSSLRKEDRLRLRCVESLHIPWGLSVATLLGQLFAWLEVFPELKKLSICSAWQWPVVKRSALPSFFEQVKLVCPTIASISFHWADYGLCYKYPS